jgi:hypothetical protein
MSVGINNTNIYENLNNPVTFANTPSIKPNQNPRAHELKCVNTQNFPYMHSVYAKNAYSHTQLLKQLVIKR